MMIKAVLWDWNGTLLDDVEINLRVLNYLLRSRNLPEVGIDEYRGLFKIPIIDFYTGLGFAFLNETFDDVAREYVTLYHYEYDNMNLTAGARDVLVELSRRGIRQFVVSATNERDLLKQVRKKGIEGFFEKIVGNDDIHGKSKKQKALELAARSQLREGEVLFVGDTDHDYEVARSIGACCVLYGNGHQRIPPSDGYVVIERMADVVRHL